MKDEKIIMIIIKMKRNMKRIIKTLNAPAAIGPYSQAVEINGTLYISGQIAIDPKTGNLVDGGITAQTKQVLKNIDAILHEAGYSFIQVVKSTCLLSDISNFKAMNEVYAQYYFENQPARAAFAVKDLPLGALVEIETIAVK
jgi:2-iminobutanoate/2-iminopropanoate deaminase